MSEARRVLSVLVLALAAAACAPREEPPAPVAGPIAAEPVFHGKYR